MKPFNWIHHIYVLYSIKERVTELSRTEETGSRTHLEWLLTEEYVFGCVLRVRMCVCDRCVLPGGRCGVRPPLPPPDSSEERSSGPGSREECTYIHIDVHLILLSSNSFGFGIISVLFLSKYVHELLTHENIWPSDGQTIIAWADTHTHTHTHTHTRTLSHTHIQ